MYTWKKTLSPFALDMVGRELPSLKLIIFIISYGEIFPDKRMHTPISVGAIFSLLSNNTLRLRRQRQYIKTIIEKSLTFSNSLSYILVFTKSNISILKA